MKEYNNNRGGGGGYKKSYGGARGNNRGDHRGGRDFDKKMYKVDCASCGKTAEVPFRPSGDKPVYCRDCFGGPNDSGARSNDRGGDRNRYQDRKPGNFRDRGSHDRPARSNGPDTAKLQEQINALHAKVDRILGVLEGSNRVATNDATSSDTAEAKKVVAKRPKAKAGDLTEVMAKVTREAGKEPAKKKAAKKAKAATKATKPKKPATKKVASKKAPAKKATAKKTKK